MSNETIFSKVLEIVESLKLPEGEYLEACNLIKECHKHSKDRWISETKVIPNRYGIEMFNAKGYCIIINLKKICFWKMNNSDSKPENKPEDIYTFQLEVVNDKKKNIISKIIEKPLEEILDFIGNFAKLQSINKYNLFIENVLTSSEEMYDWIQTTRNYLKKVMEINQDSEDEDFHLNNNHFYAHIASDVSKVFQVALYL